MVQLDYLLELVAPAESNVVRLDARPTDAELVESARDGDAAAAEALFRRYVGMASATVYRLLGRDTELEDIVQESFLAALSTLGRLERPQAFSAWLSRIVVGTTVATLRRRRLLRRLGLLRPEPIQLESLIAPNAPPDVAVDLARIYRSIEGLPTKERVVLVLRRVEGFTIAEVAERTGWSAATVKRKLRAAEQRLAPSLNDPLEAP